MNSIYGTFDEQEACFRITLEPPRKWWNLHTTDHHLNGEEMYAEVTHIGDGQTWVRDAAGVTVRLVGYDRKYLYLRNETTGTVFCPGAAPVPTPLVDQHAEIYPEKTVIGGSCEGIQVTQRVFVPRQHALECHTAWVANQTHEERELSLFMYVGFDGSGTDSEGRGVGAENVCEIFSDLNAVLCRNRNPYAPTQRSTVFLMSLQSMAGANGYRDHFTHADYSLGAPRILSGWNCDGRPGYGSDCAGIIQMRIRLKAREKGRVDFVLGLAENLEEVRQIRSGLQESLLDAWCDEAAVAERKQAESFRVDVGNPAINGLFNIFVKKQMHAYLVNKSGFRDNLQVDVPFAMVNQAAAEKNFLRALASQYRSGMVPHGFRPLNRLTYSDKPAWILYALPELIKESGDASLLEQSVPFLDGGQPDTVWVHALRAMRYLAGDLGPNGLCDQHVADWNDGLEATEASGGRESVFVSLQLCQGLREIRGLAQFIGDTAVAEEAQDLYMRFRDRINEVAWDGGWYVRTLCADGYRIGSKNSAGGRIYLNPQCWAVLSGVADAERAQTIMDRVEEELCTDIGYRICSPPYSAFDARVGRMSESMPGANENGGCYNHAAGFKGVADCMLGRADRAWETFIKVTPGNPRNPISQSGAEPFSYVNSYSSVPQIYGQSGYAWRTGTSAWMTRLLVEFILGARRSYEGLCLDPCLPSGLTEARVNRRFRGAEYDIKLHNRSQGGKGIRKILLDGESVPNHILTSQAGSRHDVDVFM